MALTALAVMAACGKSTDRAPGDASGRPASTGVATNGTLPAPDDAASRPVVLFLGTSLTAGLGLEPDSAYPQQLQRKIDERGLRFQTVNAGVSGETAAGLLRRLDWVLQRPAAVIVVETGANDGLRGQPVEATRTTIGRILDRIHRDRPEARVLLVQMEAPPNLGAGYTRAFHGMFPELARAHGVTLIPFLLEGVAGFPALNQADGTHPNQEGERRVVDNVWRALAPELAKIDAGALPEASGNR